MDWLNIVLIGMAVLALLGVIFEEATKVNKAKVTLFLGTLSWLILFVTSPSKAQTQTVSSGLAESLSEIATLWLFLVAAMTFVAYLNKKGMIENLIYLVMPKRIHERHLFFLTGLFCFIFSSLADNITATLVSCTLILSLNVAHKIKLKFITLVVFAVNSGGVALITGDVTTLMIFLAGKVEILDLLLLALPASMAVLLLAFLLSRGMNKHVYLEQDDKKKVRGVDIAIGVLFLLTIISTIIGNVLFDIPPVLMFLFGMSAMFLIYRFFSKDSNLDPIIEYVRVIEFETLLFFLGILLLVGMLKEIQVLGEFVVIYDVLPPFAANYLMGIFSALIDNVPLTAALLKAGIVMSHSEWLGLAYAVGVGGSLLIIGSAAGIVAMSKIEGLTFGSYLKYCLHLLVAYTAGYAGVYFIGTLM